jgi:membrane-bound lytic murein transglycosylase A
LSALLAMHVIRKLAVATAWMGLLLFGQASLPDGAHAGMKLHATAFDDLPGWKDDDHQAALGVFVSACGELASTGAGFARQARLSGAREDWLQICRRASSVPAGPATARHFFEQNFAALRLDSGPGHFTGYFEPEIEGSRRRSAKYPVPVLARPDDLVKLNAADASRLGLTYGRIANGKGQAYFTRQEIEEGILDGRGLELAWVRSWADLFFMQVQGSGRIRMNDGSVMRLAYAAKSGLPYTSIGKVLIERGEMTREGMSMQALRAWLDANPHQARELMWRNRSYVFFRRLDDVDPSLGPVGAQKLPLTPMRSLAADRSYWALGVPVWVSTQIHNDRALEPFNRLMIVQDTGSAIRGPQRGDIFFGTGDEAAIGAGKLDQPGEIVAVVPVALAKKLLKRQDQ